MFKTLVLCIVTAAVAGLSIQRDRIEDLKRRFWDIKNELNANETDTRSEGLKQIVTKISLQNSRQDGDLESGFLCGMCLTVVDDFLSMRRTLMHSEQSLKTLAVELCVDFEVQSEEVCHGVVELNTPSIIYIVDRRPDLTAETVCKLLLNDGDCFAPYNDDRLEFTIDIDHGKTSEEAKPVESSNTSSIDGLTIVHISDIHFDPKYTKAAFADCDEPACCRETDDINEEDAGSLAGLWGDYRSCDTPWRAIVDALHQITKQHSVNIYCDISPRVTHFPSNIVSSRIEN